MRLLIVSRSDVFTDDGLRNEVGMELARQLVASETRPITLNEMIISVETYTVTTQP